ncbi:MAG: DsbA family oxidoreductase [Myxococcaceae bacterium]
MGSRRMVVLEVFADVVCPWCFIGQRRLKKAMALHPELEVKVRLRAYTLHPEVPQGGEDAKVFFGRKYGGPKGAVQALERVTAQAAVEGLAVDFSKLKRVPHSAVAQRVLHMASQTVDPLSAYEALAAGLFARGANLADARTCIRLLSDANLSFEGLDFESRLRAGEGLEELAADQRAAVSLGVDAVPFIMADDRFGLRGAAAVSDFEEILTTAGAARPRRTPVQTVDRRTVA